MAVAVLGLVYNHIYPVGGIPQQGPIRFGLPIILILAAVIGARSPRWQAQAGVIGFGLVGLSSIWAIEAFIYTAITFAALVLLAAARRPEGRPRWLERQALGAAAACVAAHLLFAVATLAFAGELPDWGLYFAYLDAFLGDIGDITYDFSPWSPAFAVGAANLASAAAVVLVARRLPQLLRDEPVALTALAGMSAYGVALFSYFVDRSGDHILPYISVPPLLCATLWIALLLRRGELSQRTRSGALGFGFAVAALMVAAAWPSASDFIPRSALAHAGPGGKSLRDAVDRLWNPPPLDSRAPRGEALLDAYMTADTEVLMVVPPDLGLEILFRSERGSELPLGDPWEDSFISEEHFGPLGEAVGELKAGDRLLLEAGGLGVIAAKPPIGSRAEGLPEARDGGLATLQHWVLWLITDRFRLRILERDPNGLLVAELVPKASVSQ
jgi:hypothetical protein